MFKIKDINFDIKFAYLDSFIDVDEKLLKFGLQIKTEGNENIFDGYEPHFNSEMLLKIKPNTLNNHRLKAVGFFAAESRVEAKASLNVLLLKQSKVYD